MTIYVIGARGRLGQAIMREYVGQDVRILNRSDYQAWSRPAMEGCISRYFDTGSGCLDATIFVASGLLNPALSHEELLGVNYYLPKNIIDGATKLSKGHHFRHSDGGFLHAKNPYVETKALLGKYVNEGVAAGKRATHLQIHTLFGAGLPSSFMFLGQMLSAIQEGRSFKMTSGRQLREYHHLDDEARAIRIIADLAVSGVMDLSHGRPVSLREIATSVFGAFGRNKLLCIGALAEPPEENYKKILAPTPEIDAAKFRESLPAIVQYMKNCFHGQEV